MIAYKQRVIDMDKLTMAHEYMVSWLKSGNAELDSAEELALFFFDMAEIMQAEAEKRDPLNGVKRNAYGNVDVVDWQPDWSVAPDDVTAWEYLGYGSARWHTTTKGFYKEAPSFDRPYYGAMVLHKRPQGE